MTGRLDTAKLQRQQEQPQNRTYSITSTNKAYGDSLEIFDPTTVFSCGVSVF